MKLHFSMKKQMEKHLHSLNTENLKVGLHRKDKIHGKPCRQLKTNWSGKNWKCDRFQISWTNHTPQRYHKRKSLCKDQSSMELFKKKKKKKRKEILQDRQPPISLKKKKKKSNGPMCLANNDLYQTWSLNKQLTNWEPLKEQWRGKSGKEQW